MSTEQGTLDARLYGQFSTVPVVRPENTVISGNPVVKTSPAAQQLPLWSFKIALVEQSLQPGACVGADCSGENGINDNLLFNWRHQYRKGGLLPSGKICRHCFRDVNAGADNKIPAPAREPGQINTPSDKACCELVLPGWNSQV